MALVIAVEALRAYTIPEEKADYLVPQTVVSEADMDVDIDCNIDPQLIDSPGRQPPPETQNPPLMSNLRLFPPPLFSRQTIPQAYKLVVSFSCDHDEFISIT